MKPVVFYFSDGNDRDYLIASIRSLLENGEAGEPIVFSYESLELPVPHRMITLPPLELCEFQLGKYRRDVCISMCMRVAAIDWLAQEGVEKAIYLDTDTVVLRPLTEIVRFLDGGGVFGGVLDVDEEDTGQSSGWAGRAAPVVDVNPYVNSGVLALNVLALCKSGPLTPKLQTFFEHHRRAVYPDQDFLNFIAHDLGVMSVLPKKFNAMMSRLATMTDTVTYARRIDFILNEAVVAHYAWLKPAMRQTKSALFYRLILPYLPEGDLKNSVLKNLDFLHPLAK